MQFICGVKLTARPPRRFFHPHANTNIFIEMTATSVNNTFNWTTNDERERQMTRILLDQLVACWCGANEPWSPNYLRSPINVDYLEQELDGHQINDLLWTPAELRDLIEDWGSWGKDELDIWLNWEGDDEGDSWNPLQIVTKDLDRVDMNALVYLFSAKMWLLARDFDLGPWAETQSVNDDPTDPIPCA